ncbi:kinase-like protein [Delitschia confertaspora ATCC 74209]|uniref:Kinase-like protein n=1 Tax=Delitschia confertaspora ATCC 74209 TaxID=1513339 RepID=A0A9P4MW59_9PLEO|nr:kinase-like protein [Delitschia confertaspora ATCC 74209]
MAATNANTAQLEIEFRNFLRTRQQPGHSAEGSCPFIPYHVLRDYLDGGRLQEVLSAYGQRDSAGTIQRKYLRVFAVLILIKKVEWIGYFLQQVHSDDSYLPFYPLEHPPYFLSPERIDFFEEFYKTQWQFCALKFEKEEMFSNRDYEPKQILPIIEKEPLKTGASCTTYKITLHDDYNLLFAKDDNRTHKPKVFVLKTYSIEFPQAKRYYHNEVDAFKNLMEPKKVEQNIVTFYGSWRQDTTYNVLLEYADQGTLLDYFERNEPPEEAEDIIKFWSAILDLVKGLQRIHELELFTDGPRVLQGIHQDVKPSNILVCSGNQNSPYDVVFKLADMGLSHFTAVMKGEDAESIDGYGTAMYSAPECCRADTFRERSDLRVKPLIDIWSLECVLSEVAVWTVFGNRRLLKYRDLRAAETDQIPQLKAAGYSGCFHNGRQVLQAVFAMHKKLRANHRNSDYIIEPILMMVENMLVSHRTRWTALQVYDFWQQILEKAKEQQQYPGVFQTIPYPVAPRIPPPELPPEMEDGDTMRTGISLVKEIQEESPSEIISLSPITPKNSGRRQSTPHRSCDQQGSSNPHGPNSVIERAYNMPPLRAKKQWPNALIQSVHVWMQAKKENKPFHLPGEDYARRLNGRDHVFLIDDSASMKDHWLDVVWVFQALGYLVKATDPDGIDILLANSLTWHHHKHTTELKDRLLRVTPRGRCNMKEALAAVLKKYGPETDKTLEKPRHRSRFSISLPLSPKLPAEKRGLSIYVLTDGVWQDGPRPVCGVEEPIELVVSKLKDNGLLDFVVGVQFIQFGDDKIGTERLELLDSGLKEEFGIDMDIVDTTHSTGNVWKMLLGAIDRHWDDDKTPPPSPTPTKRQSYQPLDHNVNRNTFHFRNGDRYG